MRGSMPADGSGPGRPRRRPRTRSPAYRGRGTRGRGMPRRVNAAGPRPAYRGGVADLRSRRWVPDAGLALALFAVTVVTGSRRGPHARDPAARLLAACACATVLVRRRLPEAAFVAAAVLAESYLAASGSEAGVLVLAAPLIALYTI